MSVLRLENVLPLPGLALGLGAILPPTLHWSSLLKLTPTLKKGILKQVPVGNLAWA